MTDGFTFGAVVPPPTTICSVELKAEVIRGFHSPAGDGISSKVDISLEIQPHGPRCQQPPETPCPLVTLTQLPSVEVTAHNGVVGTTNRGKSIL